MLKNQGSYEKEDNRCVNPIKFQTKSKFFIHIRIGSRIDQKNAFLLDRLKMNAVAYFKSISVNLVLFITIYTHLLKQGRATKTVK